MSLLYTNVHNMQHATPLCYLIVIKKGQPVIDPSLLKEAAALVNGDRQKAYGSPEENLGRIAGLWSAYLATPVSASDVAQMMVLVKVARSVNTYKRDNYLDAIGYLLLAEGLYEDQG